MEVKELIQKKIQEKNSDVASLQIEIRSLEIELKNLQDKIGIEKWLGYEFESSSSLTEEFNSFAKNFKRELSKQLPIPCLLSSFMTGHFFLSCFIFNSLTGKFVYLSVPDVRHFKNEWYFNILIRTAKSDKDYTGGNNWFCSWKNLKEEIKKISQ